MNLTKLDTFRAEKMKEYLNEKGQNEIWRYDISYREHALSEALDRYDFDNISIGMETKKPFCLVGPGIVDHYFATEEELDKILIWLCKVGELSCYKKIDDFVQEKVAEIKRNIIKIQEEN